MAKRPRAPIRPSCNVTRLVLAPRALLDIERLADFLVESDPHSAAETGALLLDGLSILKNHPLVGHKVEDGFRELVISRGRTGYLALYDYDVMRDTAIVLAIRHQRERGHSADEPR
ncbi:MAG TPA: type II toxin-antitoxin system RelE/ParE family toxin [Parasulfuritortus sp.]